jgi:hypothetical protein
MLLCNKRNFVRYNKYPVPIPRAAGWSCGKCARTAIITPPCNAFHLTKSAEIKNIPILKIIQNPMLVFFQFNLERIRKFKKNSLDNVADRYNQYDM